MTPPENNCDGRINKHHTLQLFNIALIVITFYNNLEILTKKFIHLEDFTIISHSLI